MKPVCKLIGQNGNIFNLIGIASNVLKEHNMKTESREMTKRVFECTSYEMALCVIKDYVEVR